MSVMADDAPRVAVVTGAASGMGRACSVALLDIADVLVLVDRHVEQLRSAAQDLPDGSAITRVASHASGPLTGGVWTQLFRLRLPDHLD
jgi:NADP-dependent 3-hydroxy acid dehydrogenase YdfG